MDKSKLNNILSAVSEIEELSKQNFFSDQEIETIRNNAREIKNLILDVTEETKVEPVQVEPEQIKQLVEPIDAIKSKYARKLKELRLDKLKNYKHLMTEEEYSVMFTKISESDPLLFHPEFAKYESKPESLNDLVKIKDSIKTNTSKEEKLYKIAKVFASGLKILGKVGVAMQNSYENTGTREENYQRRNKKQTKKQKKQKQRRERPNNENNSWAETSMEDFRKMSKLWGGQP